MEKDNPPKLGTEISTADRSRTDRKVVDGWECTTCKAVRVMFFIPCDCIK